MASFNDNKRGENLKRRLDDPRRRRQSVLVMETLENRRLLAATPVGWHPGNSNLNDAQNGPMANLGPQLVKAYGEYQAYYVSGSHGTFVPNVGQKIDTIGNDVYLDLRGQGNATTYVHSLQALGFVVTGTLPSLDYVEGYAPYSSLPAIAEDAQTVGGAPIFAWTPYQQGVSPNQADIALNVAAARQTLGVNGAGQMIGVISTDDGTADGGILASVKSGDLPPNVLTLDDSSGTTDDEGRAMLEQIYDLAPGAKLAFATGFPNKIGSELGIANAIQALFNAGSRIIVDDLGSPVDPYYQDGIISQEINKVVAAGAVYVSAAGNQSNSGYESQFRPVTATVGSLGSGTYMNFDPTGATTTTELGIDVYTPNTAIALQFDQPFYTTAGVNSSVEIDVLDQAGNLVQQANMNNVATQLPYQFTGGLAPGLYNVVIKVDSGPNPGHVLFLASGDGGFSVDTKFGAAGGTYYPSTTGHNSGAETISVGAVPFWSTPNYVHTPALDTNEPYSSTGPVLKLFNGDGTPLPAPQLLLKPDVSATDANNTSFFAAGEFLNTSDPTTLFPNNPPYPGDPSTTFAQPTTPTNQSVPTLENFTGTSSAAPNLAAIIALMKQANPTVSRNEIVTDLENTTTSLDGVPAGTWSPQAGYGLVNALAAVSAVQNLKVLSIVPGGNQTIVGVPQFITVTFSQNVNIATLSPANLLFAPTNGATVTVGQPIGVDSATFPSIVEFPITITPAAGRSGNGLYKDAIVGPNITSQTGRPLSSPYADQFNLQDVNGPRVALTTYFGRIVTIAFSGPLNPATVNPNNIFVFRDGGVNNPNLGPNAVIVSQLPGATFTYNPTNFTVTINLSGVAQSSLPTDHYGLVIRNSVSDTINNPLNGFFNGVFPSGTNPEGQGGTTFFQDLGVVNLQAPIISSLTLAPISDSGIQGDNNTNINTPSLVGQVTATFPGTVGGLLVYAEFNGISHPGVAPGGLDLGLGMAGRGFLGHYDVQTTTNALGQFVINYPPGVTPLPDGLNRVRVIVVGAPDIPPLPGLASVQDTSFRVDTTNPIVAAPPGGGLASSIVNGENINVLSNLTINFADPINPTTIGSPFAVPATLAIPALNPVTADNVNSYKLYLVNGQDQIEADESGFITSATFVPTSARVLTSDPYTGQVNLTFAPGLPSGQYVFVANSSAYGVGLSDAAGNPLNGMGPGGSLNYVLSFTLQPTPTYITSYVAYTPDPSTPGGFDTSGVRANYELPVSGVAARAEAPPSMFSIDFSNSLNPNLNYTQDVELVGSGLNSSGLPTGNFGDLGTTNTSGFNVVAGTTVTLTNSVPGARPGQFGYDDRLLITLPAGFTLPANYYRVYLPNTGNQAINDVFGNQLDGEFLGYQNGAGKFVDQLQNGQIRGAGVSELPDLSGDGNAGGAFMTGFVVVPNGNIIFAAADALYNPLIPSEIPDGSLAKPYPVLAPEAVPNAVNGGDLNSSVNSGANFNPTFDRSGDGQFEPSAFFAAQQRLQTNGGPVVVIAEASVPSRDPATGLIVQKPFVLQAPNPSGNQAATSANDASAAIPALTTLVFDPGSIVKLQNAALLVQNQGSALQIDGGPNSYQSVIVTSFKDSTVGGVSNGDPNSIPNPGDYGGIAFRNFSQAALPGQGAARADLFPGQIPITGVSTEDQRLKGQFSNLNDPTSQADAVSGADDVMSSISFLTERFAGGTVPATLGTQYDGITLLNSRPAIVNSIIADAGGTGAAVAGLSVDVNSLRADDVAQGPLVRNDQFINNGLNGIYIRANNGTGVAEPTDAIAYPTNPTNLGGAANYVLNDPYPYLLTSKMEIGQRLIVDSGGAVANTTDRLYIVPGMLVKFESGASLEIGQDNGGGGQSTGASLVVGDPTYIKEFDVNNAVNPTSQGFTANSTQLAKVLFTSLNDNGATTFSTNPVTQVNTPIVAALPALPAAALTPAPTAGSWGGIQLDAGTRDTINSAVFNYGGGFVNTPAGASTLHALEINRSDGIGAYVSITNNTFLNNLDVPINTSPNAWLATDPETPLDSGAPFIHGNLFVNNGYNGVGVQGGTIHNAGTVGNYANLDVSSTWTGGDFTYFLRDTVVLGPNFGGIPAAPPANSLVAPPTPNVVLTLQSNLPSTVLADGSVIAAPGVPIVIKLLNAGSTPQAETLGTVPGNNILNSYQQGASFIVGVDNGVDPPADQLLDPGAFSEIRVVGIGANQSTGQARVPVIITSAYDDTVGTTVNGVQMNQLIPGNKTSPAAGDGGVIYYGGNSMTSYNLTDPRSGSIIDNADLKYLTRVEQQGGGIVYGVNAAVGASAFNPTYNALFGLPLPSIGPNGTLVNNYSDQYNSPKSITVSNSNFSNFSSAAFYAHPGTPNAIISDVNFLSTTLLGRASNFNGEPTHTYFYNDTFSGTNTGIYILSQSGADIVNGGPYPTPAMAVILNDDFYNVAIGVHTNGQGGGLYAHTATLVMDSIFDGSTTAAIEFDKENFGGVQNEDQNHAQTIIPSQAIYDDFFNDAAQVLNNGGPAAPGTISKAFTTDPGFRNPQAGNFFLLPTSSIIDVGRSELGPSIFGDMLYPQVTPVDINNPTGPSVRNEPVYIGGNNLFGGGFGGALDQTQQAGDINYSGGLGYFQSNSGPDEVPYYSDYVTLPGQNYVGSTQGQTNIKIPDQWVEMPQGTPGSSTGNGAAPGTYAYVPIIGQRDQVGDLRQKDPNSPNLGYGTKPYFDLGAFEYIVQNPPIVEGVSATTASGTTNIYGVGTVDGVNMLPTSIQFLFNEQLNPATINGMSVILEASGGDGVFGNGNSPLDRTISLAGLTSFNNATDILTINTSGIFNNLASDSDEYRIILKGTGSAVIRDNSGLALDGMNLDASGNQLPLPSGSDMFPGSDFQLTFTIDTHPPSLVPGTFRLDPASDTSGGLNITNIKLPTFDGTITDTFPPVNFLQGQKVYIDVSSRGDGVFDILDAGVGTTDAQGNFRVTLTTPIPDTPHKVGVNGIQEGPGSLLTLVRVRVVDQSGNASNLPTDPIGAYANEQALTGLQEDTVLPKVSSFSPLSNTVAMANANGQVVVTVTFTKNIKTATLNANSILVQRSGGTGNFTNPVAVPIVPGSFVYSFSTAPTTLGYETVSFAIASNQPNDEYRITLKGTGASPITDLAGNPLDGQGIGQGSDFVNGPFVFYNASNAHLIYVGTANDVTTGTGVLGTRENPFPTIGAGLKAASLGDDVLVLPGAYREDVTMKPGVRLLSADPSSTDTSFLAGSPYETLIYGVPSATLSGSGGNNITTVSIFGSAFGIPTEVSGFAIISPLLGDSNLGQIDTTDDALQALNSNAAIDRNIIVNANVGLFLSTVGGNAPTPVVYDNLIVGNITGIEISDGGATSSLQSPFMIVNNTIADNTTGLLSVSTAFNYTQAYVVNNIFYSNHSLSTQRTGTGIAEGAPDTLAVGNNLFYQNGPTNSAASNATGTFNGFNPALLSAKPDALGNILGNPFFAMPEDPRPNGDTPSVFFNYSNFDLTSRSPAINAADNALAPSSDIEYRTPVAIAGHGFPGTGPASIGAYYYGGKSGNSGGSGVTFTGTTGTTTTTGSTGSTGSTTRTGSTTPSNSAGTVSALSLSGPSTITNSSVGGGIALGTRAFTVVTTSLSNNGTPESSDAVGFLTTEPGPAYIDVNFSDDVKASSLSPSDLLLSGSGLSPSNPAHATSLAWIDDHAVRFFLAGGYAKSGTVSVTLPQGAITDTSGAALLGFSDTFQLGSTMTPAPLPDAPVATVPVAGPMASPVTLAGPVTPTTLVSNVLPVVQPMAAAAPLAARVQPVSAASPSKPNAKELKKEAAAAKALKAAEAKAAKAAAKEAAQAAKAAHKVKKAK